MRCSRCEATLMIGYGDSVCPRCALREALRIGEFGPGGLGLEASYELIEEIGRGAMGVVWLARDRSLDRLVALKVIATPENSVLAQRFLREGQAAARLHHPHIVTVHAMGAAENSAYLAMDFLEGGNLEELLRRAPPAPHAAASLLLVLAQALAYAHAAGIVHRDLKPSNILLDDQGVPHLGDFGLAAPLAGSGDLTMPGQVAGTPAFLAPELIQGSTKASARSDLYGLGAVLYACLTGRAPFVGSAPEIFAQLRSANPPAPRLLNPAVPRDLETICCTCLEKNPARRYASAAALADDLARFLNGETIAARPAGKWEKAAGWARRKPALASALALAGGLTALLSIGGPLIALQLNRAWRNSEAARASADEAGHRARTEAQISREVRDFLENDLLAQASPDRQPDRDLKLSAALDRAAQKIEGRFPEQPLVEASIRETLGRTYAALGNYTETQRQLERAITLRTSATGAESPEVSLDKAEWLETLRNEGNYREVEASGPKILEQQRRALGSAHPTTLRTMTALSGTYYLDGKLPAAEKLLTEAQQIQLASLGENHLDTIRTRNALVALYGYEGKVEAAAVLAEKNLVIARRVLGAEHPEAIRTLFNLGVEYLNLERLAEAESVFDQVRQLRGRVLGPLHPDTLVTMKYLADVYDEEGKIDRALPLYRQTYESEKTVLGPEHPRTLNVANNFSVCLKEAGQLAEAEAVAQQTLEIRRRTIGAEHPDTIGTMNSLAEIYREEGRIDEAENWFARTLEAKTRVLGPDHPFTLKTLEDFAEMMLAEKRYADAEPLYRRIVTLRAQSPNPAWRLAAAQSHLGETLVAEEKFPEGEALLLASYRELQQAGAHLPAGQKGLVEATARQLVRLYTQQGLLAKADEWRNAGPK